MLAHACDPDTEWQRMEECSAWEFNDLAPFPKKSKGARQTAQCRGHGSVPVHMHAHTGRRGRREEGKWMKLSHHLTAHNRSRKVSLENFVSHTHSLMLSSETQIQQSTGSVCLHGADDRRVCGGKNPSSGRLRVRNLCSLLWTWMWL